MSATKKVVVARAVEGSTLVATKINVTLTGVSDIMFDRFIDHSKENRLPEKKLYLREGNVIVLPAECIYSFLFRDLSPKGVIRYVEKRAAGDYLAIGQSHIFIEPVFIPIIDGAGKQIVFTPEKDATGKKIPNGGFGGSKNPGLYYVEIAGITKLSDGKTISKRHGNVRCLNSRGVYLSTSPCGRTTRLTRRSCERGSTQVDSSRRWVRSGPGSVGSMYRRGMLNNQGKARSGPAGRG